MTLRERTIKGITWSMVARLAVVVSQFITTAVLARLLRPSDFGTVAIALIFTDVASLFGNLGVGNALIQKKDANPLHYFSAFWTNLAVSFLMIMVLFFLSPIISSFYGNPELTLIIRVISLNFILNSFIFVQQSIFAKEMDFKKLAIRDILAVFVSGAFGIGAALCGFGVWSLVFQSLIYTVINAVSLWMLSSWRPKFVFSFRHLTEILPFSTNVTGSGFLRYYIENFDRLVIGKVLGAQALGYYSLSFKVMMYPLYNISWVLSKVLFPALSTVQNDIFRVKKIYLKLFRAVSLATFPIVVGIFLGADILIVSVYGPNWQPTINLVRAMCLVGMIYTLSAITSTIYWTHNKTGLKLKMDFANACFTSIIILATVSFGLAKMVLFYFTYCFFWAHLSVFIASRLIKITLKEIAVTLKPALVSSILGGLFVFAIRQWIIFEGLVGLLEYSTIFALTYILLTIRYLDVTFDKKQFVVHFKKQNL